MKLPSSLLLGSATAATQIEGGDKKSNWYTWSLKGMIANGESSIVAADHYNRFEEDISLMQDLHQETYRMSIEWSRIEPEKGIWSHEGINHYVQELTLLRTVGIKPLVTLHHFSCPQWLQEEGAWTNPKVVEYFVRFVKKVVKALGDLVSEYCTINEPNVLATDSYIDGKYPPGHQNNIKEYFKASKHMILAHLKAYKAIHQLRADYQYAGVTRVGIAHHMAIFEVVSMNPLTQLSRKLMNYSFHDIYLKGMLEGRLVFPIGIGFPEGRGTFCDFIGVNYYSRHIIKNDWNPAMLFGKVTVDESHPPMNYNDLNWEIHPKGLGIIVKDLYNRYPMPIYITENGIANSKDDKRGKFIYDHLIVIKELIEMGIPVERYYHWSLMDNLEWNDGYTPRFGLIEVNYKTQERSIRPSGHYYGEICKTKTLLSWDEYRRTQQYE